MPPSDLSARQWKDIATLWRRLGAISNTNVEGARRQVSQDLTELFDASHVLMVIQRRVAPPSFPLGGLRPILSRDYGEDSARRLQITREWIASEPGLAQDPLLELLAQGIGQLRTIRHRADVTDEQWANAPVRRLLDRLGLEDRINGVVPLSYEVEVSFCIDRPKGAPIFDDADNRLLLEVIEGLRPLAANFVRRYGLMPGQTSLDPQEQHVLDLLLSDIEEAQLAQVLDITEARLTGIVDEIYRKLQVDNRVGLLNLWLEGVDAGQRMDPEARRRELAQLEQSPVDQVRGVLEGLEPADFDIETVARRLGMGVRSLQRRLSDSGASYRDLADEARQEKAEALLARKSLTFIEIAFRLGYEQVSSFNRAVHRWTNKTPSEFREELTADS